MTAPWEWQGRSADTAEIHLTEPDFPEGFQGAGPMFAATALEPADVSEGPAYIVEHGDGHGTAFFDRADAQRALRIPVTACEPERGPEAGG
jgi:hypothetical protein